MTVPDEKVIRLLPETRALLEKRAPTCFLCRHVIEAMSAENELRVWPPGAEGASVCMSVSGQKNHVELELRG